MADLTPQAVLVVDAAQATHDLVAARLRPEGVRVLGARDVDAALALAREAPPDLFVVAHGEGGLGFVRAAKRDAALAAIPVLFLVEAVDLDVKYEVFDAGAVDYVAHPYDSVELRARVRHALRTKRYHDMLASWARIDGPTGLWDRASFDDRLASELSIARRHARHLAVVLLEIDGFRRLHEAHGHPFADLALRRVAAVVAAATRQSDHACRHGGGAFALILRETDVAGALITAERIRAQVEALALEGGRGPVPLTASLGLTSTALLGQDATPAAVASSADAALGQALHGGGNRVVSAGG